MRKGHKQEEHEGPGACPGLRCTPGLRVGWSQLLGCTNMSIVALCAAPPEALAHSPSQMPLSCPVVPQAARS